MLNLENIFLLYCVNVGIIIISFFATKIALPFIKSMIENAGYTRPNFRGVQIPQSLGIIFAVIQIPLVTLIATFNFKNNFSREFLLLILSMSFLGLIDDFLGSRSASGFKGHFKKLLIEKELTTGALKAFGGGLVSLLVSFLLNSFLHEPVFYVFINALLIALATNLFNLLDLRPGRAIKFFFLFFILASLPIIRIIEPYRLILFAPVLGITAAYFPLDLKAKSMMGDTGSNVLGACFGTLLVMNYDIKFRVLFLVALILVHIFSEKYSITKFIQNNSLLRRFDEMGRNDN